MKISKTLLVLSSLLFAQAVVAGTPQYATENGAIDGYDPVAYFIKGHAERGSAEITTTWNDVEWRFSSPAHRDVFLSNPEKYAPQYGGFCALGMAHGGNVPTDPEAFTIWEGRLYLNMSSEVSVTWRYNPDKLTRRADVKWEAKTAAISDTPE